MEEKARLNWIDWAKFFGIILVIIAHMPTNIMPNSEYYIGILIYSFHMPLFVIISGFLYKPIRLKQEIIRSFFSLIVPYLIYNALLVILGLFVNFSHIPISYYKYILLGRQELLPNSYYVMWFIISIFLMRCLFALIHTYLNKYNEKYILLIVNITSIAVISLINLLSINVSRTDYFQLATTDLLVPFFTLGIYLNKDNALLNRKNIRFWGITGIICVVIALLNGWTIVFKAEYGKNLILFYIVATVFSLLFLSIAKNYFNKENHFVKIISIGTIFIIGFHHALINAMTMIYPVNNIFTNLLYTGLIILFSKICIEICNRYLPILIGKYKPKIISNKMI